MPVLDIPGDRFSRATWMRAALNQAGRSQCRFPMGAALVRGNRIIAGASNKKRNSPVIDYRNSTFHAEIAVLRKAGSAQGASIYVARIDANARPAMARPCARCQELLDKAGVRRVFYTTSSGIRAMLFTEAFSS